MAAKSGTKTANRSKKRTTTTRVSKGARDAASKIAELSRNRLVVEMAAAGLIAAAGVFMRSKRGRSAASKVGAGARGAASETADIAGRIGQAMASAIGNATRRFHSESENTETGVPQIKARVAAATKRGAAPVAKKSRPAAAKRRTAPIKAKDAMPRVS